MSKVEREQEDFEANRYMFDNFDEDEIKEV